MTRMAEGRLRFVAAGSTELLLSALLLFGVSVCSVSVGGCALSSGMQTSQLPNGEARNEAIATEPCKNFRTSEGREICLRPTAHCPVLLKFMASWCEACTEEMGRFVAAMKKLPGEKRPPVVVVGLLDGAEELEAYRLRTSLPFPVIVDTEGSMQSQFPMSGIPATAVLGRGGTALPFRDPFAESGATAAVSALPGPRDWADPRGSSFLTGLCQDRSASQVIRPRADK